MPTEKELFQGHIVLILCSEFGMEYYVAKALAADEVPGNLDARTIAESIYFQYLMSCR